LFDLIVRGGTLVLPSGVMQGDIAIEAGTIRAIAPELSGSSTREFDADGLHVLPALIDVHLHFNEPGRAEWEGAATGSRALAAGGGAVFFDMPLNSTPCTVNAGEFVRKRAALEALSIADFGLWGGLIPGNVSEMADMAAVGVVGFKAFMCDSGLPEFPRADDLTLYEGMREASRLNLPVAVHAESEELTRALTSRMRKEGRSSIRDFLASRPVLVELEAIQRATLIAEETGAKLHVVHISSGRGVLIAAAARNRGVDVSIETCPHYLFFTEDDLEETGALLKCTPPLRDSAQQGDLWEQVLNGVVDMVASDHSPAPPSMKSGEFISCWGGIAGAQSTLPVLLERGHHERALPLTRIARLLSATPAQRFRIEHKGSLTVGNEGDLVLLDLNQPFALRKEDMADRHRQNPYGGECFRGTILQTLRRGEPIYADGVFPTKAGGELVMPGRR